MASPRRRSTSLVSTLLATSQGTGAVSWLTYAFRLMYLPIGLFGVSIATAVLPAVSRHAALEDRDAIRATVARGIGLMLMLNVPATLGLDRARRRRSSACCSNAVGSSRPTRCRRRRRFSSTRSGWSATRRRASPRPSSTRCGQSRVPVLVSVGSIAVNIVLSLVLVRSLGFRGLALGTSLAAIVNGATLMVLLRRRLDGIDGRATGRHARQGHARGDRDGGRGARRRAGAAPLVAGHGLAASGDPAWRWRSAAGSVALAASARLLRIKEFEEALALVRARIGAQPHGGPPERDVVRFWPRTMRSLSFPLRFFVLVFLRSGPVSTALKALIGANVAVFFAQTFVPLADRRARAAADAVVARLAVAARHLHVPPRRPVAHPVQHAGAVDVRGRARADVGHALLPEVLFRHRHRRGRPDGAVLAAAVRRRRGRSTTRTSSARRARSTGCCSPTGCTFPIVRSTCIWSSRFRRSTSS